MRRAKRRKLKGKYNRLPFIGKYDSAFYELPIETQQLIKNGTVKYMTLKEYKTWKNGKDN